MVNLGAKRVVTGSRRGQRGAAVFIVVMVLTLLTAVGIFAVRSAAMADAAAGYDREGAQAALIAQYGITATAALMASGSANTFITALNDSGIIESPPNPKPDQCESNGLPPWPGGIVPPPPRQTCLRFDMLRLQTNLLGAAGPTFFAPPNVGSVANSTSSLNANETTNATFVVELTEGGDTGGLMPGGGTPVQITLTAISQVRPAAACAAALPMTTAGQQVMRAMLTAVSTKRSK